MDTKKMADFICMIIGKDKITRRQKADIITFLDGVIKGMTTTPEPKVVYKEIVTPNDIKEDPNTVDLSSAFEFKLPEELKLEVEGIEGTRTIKILPDGVSETPTEAEANNIPTAN